MDYDFLLRAFDHRAKIKYSSHILSFMRDVGISSKKDNTSLKKRFEEEKTIHFENCPNSLWKLIYNIYWLIYPSYRSLKLLFK